VVEVIRPDRYDHRRLSWVGGDVVEDLLEGRLDLRAVRADQEGT
jgi:hypothetical protein